MLYYLCITSSIAQLLLLSPSYYYSQSSRAKANWSTRMASCMVVALLEMVLMWSRRWRSTVSQARRRSEQGSLHKKEIKKGKKVVVVPWVLQEGGFCEVVVFGEVVIRWGNEVEDSRKGRFP